MAGKYNQIRISCGWKMYISLQNSVSQEETDEIFRLADLLYVCFQSLFRDIHSIEKMHIDSAYTATALYLPLKMKYGDTKALEMMNEDTKKESLKKRYLVSCFCIPVIT